MEQKPEHLSGSGIATPRAMIEDNSSQSGTEYHWVALTEGEIREQKIRLAEIQIEQMRDDEEFHSQRVLYQSRKKERALERKTISTIIHQGRVEKLMLVHYVPLYDSGIMEIYDSDGVLIQARPLLPNERQLNFTKE